MPIWQKVSTVWKVVTLGHNVSSVWKTPTVWHKVGVAWKTISQLFSPLSGSYGAYALDDTASYTINCAITATWTWSRSGSTAGFASIASGGTSTTITFSITPPAVTGSRVSTFTVSGTAGAITENYTITVEAERS